MNRSDCRLKTIVSDENKSSSYHQHFDPSNFQDYQKKISSKQLIKEQLLGKSIIKDKQRQSFIKQNTRNDLSINQNIKAKQIYCHPQSSTKKKSTLKNYLNLGEKQLKKSLIKSTTKKHSKSVFNYLDEIQDQKPLQKHNKSNKKLNTKSSCYHQTSTSSVTKRKKSKPTASKNSITQSQIKQKIDNFKIVSNCLKVFIQDQEKEHHQINANQIIKMVKAFNKVQISKMSKPLQKLIENMILIIQDSVNRKKPNTNLRKQTNLQQRKQYNILQPNILQKMQARSRKQQKNDSHDVTFKFQTPNKYSHVKQRIDQSHSKKRHLNQFIVDERHNLKNQLERNHSNSVYSQNMNQFPDDISKTKKMFTQISNPKQNGFIKQVIEMEKDLQELQAQSNQLQNIIYSKESSQNASLKDNKSNISKKQQKWLQITKLRQILQYQEKMMSRIENLSLSEQQVSVSDQSSLKYYPADEQ